MYIVRFFLTVSLVLNFEKMIHAHRLLLRSHRVQRTQVLWLELCLFLLFPSHSAMVCALMVYGDDGSPPHSHRRRRLKFQIRVHVCMWHILYWTRARRQRCVLYRTQSLFTVCVTALILRHPAAHARRKSSKISVRSLAKIYIFLYIYLYIVHAKPVIHTYMQHMHKYIWIQKPIFFAVDIHACSRRVELHKYG